MKVTEIFSSIDGEGKRIGELVTFIRLYGCNLHCSYCDSRYSCDDNNYTEMSINMILAEVEKLHNKKITLTGGEPLIHENVCSLIETLVKYEYEVNIETNGSVDLEMFIEGFSDPREILEHVFFTMDYKCNYSEMSNKMCLDNLYYLDDQDVLKFVVANENDMEQADEIIQKYFEHCSRCECPQIYFSPVFDQIEPVEIVNHLKNTKQYQNNQYPVHVQVQLHKIIWSASMRGV